MTQHVHFDENKVRALIEKIAEERKRSLNAEGYEGAYARLAAEIMPRFQMGLTQEVNRGVTGNDLSLAIAALTTNFIMSWVMSVVSDKSSEEERAVAINHIMIDLARMISFAIDGVNNPDSEAASKIMRGSVAPEQGGRA